MIITRKYKYAGLFLVLLGLLLGTVLCSAQAQTTQAEQAKPSQFKLLIVDETQTFGSTIRLQVLASLLKKTGRFTLAAKFVQVESSFADPLQGLEPDERYDLILIIPRGVDDGTVKQLWIATRPFPEISEGLRAAVALLKKIADRVFSGAATAVDVTDDLIPGYFATLFIREGWL